MLLVVLCVSLARDRMPATVSVISRPSIVHRTKQGNFLQLLSVPGFRYDRHTAVHTSIVPEPCSDMSLSANQVLHKVQQALSQPRQFTHFVGQSTY